MASRENGSELYGGSVAPSGVEVGGQGPLVWAALVASTVACAVPLGIGVVQRWPWPWLALYSSLALAFVALSQLPRLRYMWACRLLERHALLLTVFGAMGLALQMLSGDPFLQPMVFTVPFVFAALFYSPWRAAAIGVAYLGLMAVGLWFGGNRYLSALVFPVLGYACAMGVIFAFTRLSIEQATARQEADALARDLARQRDDLERLVRGTADLARELEASEVVGRIAVIGAELATAASARVWLPATESDAEPFLAASTNGAAALTAGTRAALANAAVVAAAGVLNVPLVFQARTLGVLELRAAAGSEFRPTDAQLLQPFASAAAVAIENARLYQQAHESATLAERNRLARELHDTIAQGLTAINLQLEAAQRAFTRDPERARARMGRAADITRATLGDVRRSVWTLASPLVAGDNIGSALRGAADAFTARSGVAVVLVQAGPPPLVDHAVATQVVRIVQEALHNVEKHAEATDVRLLFDADATRLRVEVVDNGHGFDPARSTARDGNGGFGLISLHERARLAGGALTISSAPGAGTHVTLEIRLSPHPEEQL